MDRMDRWRDWREHDRGMEGPRPYGSTARREEYAGFRPDEDTSRREWARNYMPDRGYSAYGGDYRRQNTGYGTGYPGDREYGRDFDRDYDRDFGRSGFDRDHWREREDRYDRDDRTWRERMRDAGERMRDQFRGDRDMESRRTFGREGFFDRNRSWDDDRDRYASRTRPDVGRRLSAPFDDEDHPWDTYREGRSARDRDERWDYQDRNRWRR